MGKGLQIKLTPVGPPGDLLLFADPCVSASWLVYIRLECSSRKGNGGLCVPPENPLWNDRRFLIGVLGSDCVRKGLDWEMSWLTECRRLECSPLKTADLGEAVGEW